MPPNDDAESGPSEAAPEPEAQRYDRRQTDRRVEQLEHEVEDLKQAFRMYADRIAALSAKEPELAAATEGLTAQVENLGGALTQVNQLTRQQQDLAQAQVELAGKVVLQTAFDDKWEENAGELERVVRTSRRYALVALAVVIVLVGSGAGWLINYQVGQNHSTAVSTRHTETLNKQRIAACEQKNQALEQGVQAFGAFIAQEKALAHPDVVVVEVLELVRLSTQAQIIPCPGASPSDVPTVPPVTPGSTPTFLLTPPPSHSAD